MNIADIKIDLLKRGWSTDEIDNTLNILKNSPKKRDVWVVFLDTIMYWFVFFMTLVGNFVVSVVLIPYVMLSPDEILYPGVFFVSLSFGALFDLITWDLEKIEESPKFSPGIFFFAVALINITIIMYLCKQLTETLAFHWPTQKFVFIGITYVLGFMIPYFFTRKYFVRK